MFNITDNKGFHMRFDNGWTASIQWGGMNYCDNRSTRIAGMMGQTPPPSSTAEIAAWDSDGTYHKFPSGDTVEGWQTTDEVAAFIAQIAGKGGER